MMFYILTTQNEEHPWRRGTFYHDGVNITLMDKSPYGGTMLFTHGQLLTFQQHVISPYWIREVTLMDDTKCQKLNGMTIVDKCFLHKREKFDISVRIFVDEEMMDAVKLCGKNIHHMKNPPFSVIMAAIEQNPWVLLKLPYQSEFMKIAAIKREPSIFHHIKHPSQRLEKLYEACT